MIPQFFVSFMGVSDCASDKNEQYGKNQLPKSTNQQNTKAMKRDWYIRKKIFDQTLEVPFRNRFDSHKEQGKKNTVQHQQPNIEHQRENQDHHTHTLNKTSVNAHDAKVFYSNFFNELRYHETCFRPALINSKRMKYRRTHPNYSDLNDQPSFEATKDRISFPLSEKSSLLSYEPLFNHVSQVRGDPPSSESETEWKFLKVSSHCSIEQAKMSVNSLLDSEYVQSRFRLFEIGIIKTREGSYSNKLINSENIHNIYQIKQMRPNDSVNSFLFVEKCLIKGKCVYQMFVSVPEKFLGYIQFGRLYKSDMEEKDTSSKDSSAILTMKFTVHLYRDKLNQETEMDLMSMIFFDDIYGIGKKLRPMFIGMIKDEKYVFELLKSEGQKLIYVIHSFKSDEGARLFQEMNEQENFESLP